MKASCLYFSIFLLFSCQVSREKYVCPPCGMACDTLVFNQEGVCPHCKMELQTLKELSASQELVVNEVEIKDGSGVFLVDGGNSNEKKRIRVYYYKPRGFNQNSSVLLVVPGAGRNGDSYRDAWIEASEKHQVLILSPEFVEDDYGFEDYHLGGILDNLNIESVATPILGTNIIELNEDSLTFMINFQKESWIFKDFDRIFDMAVEEVGSGQIQYDIFGHSAGGQILHRMALFYPQTKANRIIASNSGFYTLPQSNLEMPFGTKSVINDSTQLQKSFVKKLVLLLGELDNQAETRGTLLMSPSANIQGAHRLERGMYFYDYCKSKALFEGLDFRWELKVIPNVGHDHEKMAIAAAAYLYDLSDRELNN